MVVLNFSSLLDTSYIVSLTDTSLVTMDKVYSGNNASYTVLYDLYRYAKKQ
jgi:hypothetical protein